MNRPTILGDMGFSLGIVSIFMVILPLFKPGFFLGTAKNSVFALLIGMVGLILADKQSKRHAGGAVKFVFLVNLIAIVLAVISLVSFWIG